MSNPLEQIAQTLMGGTGPVGSDLLWCIDERSFQQYIARRSQLGAYGHFVAPTASMLTDRRGATAVISIHGVMVKSAEWCDEVAMPVIEQATRQLIGDSSIEAVAFDMDTPGGSTSGLTELGDAVSELAATKPVQFQCTGLCCSAGYYLASRGQKIYASNRMNILGSIGTRVMLYDFSQLFANVGIVPVKIDTGEFKSTGALGTKITDAQKEFLQSYVDQFQAEFSAAVMRGRNLDAKQLAEVADGRFWHGADAQKLGLIDGIQSLDQTLAAMPRRTIISTAAGGKTQRSKTAMKTETEGTAAEPKAATSVELKKAFPNSSAEWRESQVEAEATMEDALAAWNAELEKKLAASEKATADTLAKLDAAEKAAGKQTTASGKPALVRGNKLPAAAGASADDEAAPNYWQMARDYQAKKNCTWQEACRAVKKQHPEARDAMRGDPLPA